MTGEQGISNEQMDSYDNNFFLLTAKDLKRLMSHKNSMLESRAAVEESKQSVLRERDDLRNQLTVELAKGDINVDEIAQKIVDEKLEVANAAHTKEIDQMNAFLQQKIERNLQLEVQLDEIKDAYRALEASLSKDDKHFKSKVQLLERSMEQISSMYQNAVNERSILKVDLQVAERKLQKSMQQKQTLEKKYEGQRKKNEQLEKILLELRTELVKMKDIKD